MPSDNQISSTVGPKTLCSLWFEHKYFEQTLTLYNRIRNNLVIIITRFKQHIIKLNRFRKLQVTYCDTNALNFLRNSQSFTVII